jgi:glycine hydroxymethyltransferase
MPEDMQAPSGPVVGPADFGALAGGALERGDPQLAGLLTAELRRQQETLSMVASSSVADPSVLACAGSVLANLTTEGYPGARFHAGCAIADEVELLAAARARAVFCARYANVQPHSGSTANLCVIAALLKPGDVLLGMDLAAGGHLTHGSTASVAGRQYRAVGYGVDGTGLINYEEVARLARAHRPRLIVCGASSYPRVIDFARFRAVADSVGAALLADISHIAGLVASGLHPSPIDHAHVTTTSTYKQLCGPRGGLILSGADADAPAPCGRGTLRDLMQRAVFPMGQGTPDLGAVAAKARALDLVAGPEFRELAGRIVADAAALARALDGRGLRVLTGGTDNHIVLLDLRPRGLAGATAERALEECGIIANRNRIPGDTSPAWIGAGLRLGTNTLAVRGMPPSAMDRCARLIDEVIRATRELGDGRHLLDAAVRARVGQEVRELCARYPLPGYPHVALAAT